MSTAGQGTGAEAGLAHGTGTPRLHGVAAEFHRAHELLEAVRAARSGGYVRIDAYSPMPIEALHDELPPAGIPLAPLALVGGLIGGIGTAFLQWYSLTSAYPINVGGRTPLWPGLVPAVFEMTILGAAACTFFGMLLSNGLPRLRHPMFEDDGFAQVTRDRFVLCLRAEDPAFELRKAQQFLQGMNPVRTWQVNEERT